MVRLILPHQLFHREYDEEIVLVEHPRFFTDYNFHKQKLVLHRASLKKFENDMTDVKRYVCFNEDIDQVFRNNQKIVVYRPEDHQLRKWLQKKCKQYNCELELEESPLFLTKMSWNRQYFNENSYFQLSYYKKQRKRLDILVDDKKKPIGGKWSFDPENRKKMPQNHETPRIPEYSSQYVEEAKKYVETNFSDNPGDVDNFIYPVSRNQAIDNLEDFLEKRLENFGKYQDAFDANLDYGYHSLLSPSLNIGLITPQEVVEKTLKKHKEKNYSLNSLEGFIRQIIGWREFIRAIYHLEPDMKNKNFWEAKNPISEKFYTGNTGLEPVDQAIQRVEKNAYTHHIERLMVLGNIMLLLEKDPDEVHRWFMEMFIDSYDWVMTPNIYGMSQYSYTEMMTKPYISSSNYIQKMSNYEAGEWEKHWDGLFWNFINDHEEKISEIPRMRFMISTLNRMNENTLKEHRESALEFKQKINKETG